MPVWSGRAAELRCVALASVPKSPHEAIRTEFRGETNVSAEQARAQAPARLSQAHAHDRWAARGCPAPCQGTQAPFSLNLGIADRCHMAAAGAQPHIRPWRLQTLKCRSDFQTVRKGSRCATGVFVLEG